MSEKFHDNALICANGHVAAVAIGLELPEIRNYCDICGEELYSRCPSCGHEIRGASVGVSLETDDVEADVANYRAPNFCYRCGKPFPWTDNAVRTAKMLVKEMSGLDASARSGLTAAIDDLVAESARTELAVVRIKKALAMADFSEADAFLSIMGQIVSPSVLAKLS